MKPTQKGMETLTYGMLRLIRESYPRRYLGPGMPVRAIAKRLGQRSRTVARALLRLEAKGWTRTVDEHRKLWVALLPGEAPVDGLAADPLWGPLLGLRPIVPSELA